LERPSAVAARVGTVFDADDEVVAAGDRLGIIDLGPALDRAG
jgi:hypothetical protein